MVVRCPLSVVRCPLLAGSATDNGPRTTDELGYTPPHRHLQREGRAPQEERDQAEPRVAFVVAPVLEALDLRPLQLIDGPAGLQQGRGVASPEVAAAADVGQVVQ